MQSNRAAQLPAWVIKRAGGRRRYNKERQIAAAKRRHRVAKWVNQEKAQRWMAGRLGVHESTISRDVAAITDYSSPGRRCPVCGECYVLCYSGKCEPGMTSGLLHLLRHMR